MIGGEFLTEWILPFLLIFVIIFAILQKSKFLADGNPRTDAIVSLIAGFLAISLEYTRNVIIELMPWLGVGIAALFVFFVLYSFIVGDKMFEGKGMKNTLIAIVSVFSILVVLEVTGFWELVSSQGYTFFGEGFLLNILFLVVVGVLIYWVVKGSSNGGK